MAGNFYEDKYVDILNEALGLKRSGNYEDSIKLTKLAIKMDPHREIAYNNLGKLLHITENYAQSAVSYQKAIEFNWDAEQTLLHLGHSLIAEEITEEKEKIILMNYRANIDPYFGRNLSSLDISKIVKNINENELQRFNKKCVEKAVEYMKKKIGER